MNESRKIRITRRLPHGDEIDEVEFWVSPERTAELGPAKLYVTRCFSRSDDGTPLAGEHDRPFSLAEVVCVELDPLT